MAVFNLSNFFVNLILILISIHQAIQNQTDIREKLDKKKPEKKEKKKVHRKFPSASKSSSSSSSSSSSNSSIPEFHFEENSALSIIESFAFRNSSLVQPFNFTINILTTLGYSSFQDCKWLISVVFVSEMIE